MNYKEETKQRNHKGKRAGTIGIITNMLLALGKMLIGILSGAVNMESSKNKQCLVEDDVTGCKYLTKHPLTNNEILELESRMINGGETHGEALKNMGVLRKERKRR